MKQFGKILKFELLNYFANKAFVGITVFLVIVIAAVMFFPRVSAVFKKVDTEAVEEAVKSVMAISVPDELEEGVLQAFKTAFPDYDVQATEDSLETIKEKIIAEEIECSFVIDSLTSYTYYVNNLSMYDMNTAVADEVLTDSYKLSSMIGYGMAPEQALEIMSIAIEGKTERLGVDQMENYFYTYIMIFALYMVILLYGQMVSVNVANEKSSRAMEVLITSAKPNAMMFGKVFASCLAGFCQLVAIFGSAILFYQINKTYWGENEIIKAIFNMPISLLGYMLVFFVLGFLTYAFLFGAVGSTASKLEDINTSVTPIMLLFVGGFMVVMFSFISGNVDNMIMKVCSFIPFTSSMAMFTRIAMSTVPWYEILISVLILMATTVGTGIISAKIYRVGVLLYGTPPKLSAIIKAVKKA